ncbi:S8 family serine peptidase [Streptococcus didelphis]|uniref:S8 family serine peptidase n=1 Tax=Streptococcus didelphis TaxID=102886 RepID=UPI0027D31F09|nr:S8 family serine peptidase [Streptococcus didelphis]
MYKEANLNKAKAAKGITYGKWLSPKIAFFYNYNDKNDNLGDHLKDVGHGNNVASILAGNAQETSEDYLFKGVAPEAQLLYHYVKVTDENPKLYAQAIKDATDLGAKAINMSFGVGEESMGSLPPEVHEAFKYAFNKGVALITGAGNDTSFGGLNFKPLTENPDFGIIGSPAFFEEAWAVASYSPEDILTEVITLNSDDKTSSHLPIEVTTTFEKNKALTFQFVNYGKKEDFEGKNLTGQIALVERGGDYDFIDKMKNAKAAGAAGIIIFNNVEKDGLYQLQKLGDFPIAFMTKEAGQELAKQSGKKVTFTGEKKVTKDVRGARISNFSSWGLTPEGALKPDITAPGEDVLAAANDNTYKLVQGTSMSTPHVTGIISLLQKHFETKYPEKTDKERLDLIKKIVMSSATTLYSQADKAFYSPRQQGAGIIDAEKALNADMYLTSQAGDSKINLGDIEDQFTFTVRVHNMSDNEKSLSYQANLLSDQVEGQHFALKPRALYDTEWKDVTVAANSHTDVTITIDANKFKDMLLKEMKNGFFYDGFVRFKAKDGNEAELMSIPFLGFRGDFANLNALEKSIYDSLDGTFYYKPEAGADKLQLNYDNFSFQLEKNNYTALLTDVSSWSLIQARKNLKEDDLDSLSETTELIILGTFAKSDGLSENYYLELDENGRPQFIISPNGDSNRDFVQFQGTFLRNVKDFGVEVLDNKQNLVWKSESIVGRKTFKNQASVLDFTRWNGQDQAGNTVADGQYTYRIVYTPVLEGALEQHMEFTVHVYTQKPTLPLAANLDTESQKLTLTQLAKRDFPIYRTRIVYNYMDGDTPTTAYIEPNEDGSFTLINAVEGMDGQMIPISLDQFIYLVEDMAGNMAHISVRDLLNAAITDIRNSDQANKPAEDALGNVSGKNLDYTGESATHQLSVTVSDNYKAANLDETGQELPTTGDTNQRTLAIAGILAIATSLLLGLFKLFSKKKKK